MKALMITSFPNADLRNGLVKKLGQRGVVVTRVVDPNRERDADASGVDVVLFTFEFGPHTHQKIAEQIAGRSGKRLVLLSRKSSTWPDDLRDQTGDRSPVEEIPVESKTDTRPLVAVRDEDLDVFLDTYTSLWESGRSMTEITRDPVIVSLWRTRPFDGTMADSNRLSQFLSHLAASPRCPERFRDWWARERARERKSKVVRLPTPDTIPEPLTTPAANANDTEQLVVLYEQDNMRLTTELRAARSEALAAVQARELSEKQVLDLVRERNVVLERVAELEHQLASQHDGAEALQKNVRALDKQLDELRARLTETSTERDQERERAQKLATELAATEETLRKTTSSVERDVRKLQHQRDEQKAAADERSQIINELSAEATRLKTQQAEREKVVREQRDRILDLESQLARRQPSTVPPEAVAIVGQLRALVNAKVMTSDEAFERFAAFVKGGAS